MMGTGMIGSSQKNRTWSKHKAPVATPQRIEGAKNANVIDLAGRYVQLRRASGQEMEGPCPKCGGQDRLHVKADGWFCRNCKPIDEGGHGWHSAVDFVMFMQPGLSFTDAVMSLTNGLNFSDESHREPTKPAPPPPPLPPQTDEWRERVAPGVEAAQRALLAGDNAGAGYLRCRHLHDTATWHAYGFGFGLHREQPAIVIPWYRAGKLQAVRYRFLAPLPDSPKILSEPGSRFAGALYGGQALLGCAEDKRTLVLCEGELNAASVWQAAHKSNVDVLSLGSESQALTLAMIALANQFRSVIVWMDKPEIARKLAEQITGATAVSSPVLSNAPKGMDANDMLSIGKLGAFLAGVRLKTCRDDADLQTLLWDMYDHHTQRGGLDLATLAVLREMAGPVAEGMGL